MGIGTPGRKCMRIFGTAFATVVVASLLFCPAYAGTGKGASELGDDFQRQMPYSKERPQSGETPGQAQPEDYTAPPERERNEAPSEPQGRDFPLCYNPYTGGYENCHPEGSEYWRLRYDSPDFRFWWEHGRTCPPGYYFKPGRGCYRR